MLIRTITFLLSLSLCVIYRAEKVWEPIEAIYQAQIDYGNTYWDIDTEVSLNDLGGRTYVVAGFSATLSDNHKAAVRISQTGYLS